MPLPQLALAAFGAWVGQHFMQNKYHVGDTVKAMKEDIATLGKLGSPPPFATTMKMAQGFIFLLNQLPAKTRRVLLDEYHVGNRIEAVVRTSAIIEGNQHLIEGVKLIQEKPREGLIELCVGLAMLGRLRQSIPDKALKEARKALITVLEFLGSNEDKAFAATLKRTPSQNQVTAAYKNLEAHVTLKAAIEKKGFIPEDLVAALYPRHVLATIEPLVAGRISVH